MNHVRESRWKDKERRGRERERFQKRNFTERREVKEKRNEERGGAREKEVSTRVTRMIGAEDWERMREKRNREDDRAPPRVGAGIKKRSA